MRRALPVLGVVAALAVAAATLLRPPAREASAQPPAAVIVQKARSSYAPPASDRTPLSILAIGNDYRPREDSCGCADSLHLITVNPARSAATILGFPRDSYVDVPGHGRRKINTALKLGGPDLLVRTVEAVTGIPVDYYVLTDFEGFSRMVDSIGGLEVDVPYPMSDPYSGAEFPAGRIRMQGGHALAFARNRHDTPGGDIGRSENQGLVLIGALRKLHKDFDTDPATLVGWIALGRRWLSTDLSLEELTRLTLAASRVRIEDVRNLVVPATIGMAGAASVVYISPQADLIFDDLRDDGLLDG